MSDAGGSEGGVVGGPKTPQQVAAQRRLQQTQAQVDEVVDIMRTNVEKVLERDQKLSELDDRADALQQGASQFEQQAGKLKRKFWLKNLKMMIIMGIIGLIVIIIIGDYYLNKWLLSNYCLEVVLGFRCSNNATAPTLDTHSEPQLAIMSTSASDASLFKMTHFKTLTMPPIEVEQVKIKVTNNVRWLNRGYNVLDPAVEVEPVVDSVGQQVFDHNKVPVYRSVEGKVINV